MAFTMFIVWQGKDVLDLGESIEYAGKAVVALALDPHVLSKTGRVLLAADLGDEYNFVDVDGSKPPNVRAVKSVFEISDHGWLAAMIPSFIKIPFWIMAAAAHKF